MYENILYYSGQMDVDDMFLTTLIMIDETGVLKHICVCGIMMQLHDSVLKLSPEGKENYILL